MADCTTVFNTLKSFLPVHILEKAVDETSADHGTKKFTVLRQLDTMIYAHLLQKDSLRDITVGIASSKKLQEHVGTISASQLSRRNSQRDPKIFKIIFETVFKELTRHDGIREIPRSWGTLAILYATIMATIMRVCLNLFPWALYRKTKAAVKMHTLFDLTRGLPENIIVTEGIIYDKAKMDSFVSLAGITYIFDRGYLHYKEYDCYPKEGIYFITRLKKNAVMETLSVNAISKESPVLSDKEVILGTTYNKMQCPLRIIEVTDATAGEPFHIATNR